MAALPLVPIALGLLLGMYSMYQSKRRTDSLIHDPEELLGYLLQDKPESYLSKSNRLLETSKFLNYDLTKIAPRLSELKKNEKKVFLQHHTKS